MTIDIRIVDAASTRPLRRAVLRPAASPNTPIHGDDDPAAIHLGAYSGADLVATCLLLPRPYPRPIPDGVAWQLRGMATAEPFRDRGVGTQLLDAVITFVRDRGAELLWCEARVTAARFYQRIGFTADGPPYPHAETGAPHRLMWLAV